MHSFPVIHWSVLVLTNSKLWDIFCYSSKQQQMNNVLLKVKDDPGF